MCIDYRALNKTTVQNRYPLPRIDDVLDRLHGYKIFSSLEFQADYHQICINDEDKPKTAMITPTGQFQWNWPMGVSMAVLGLSSSFIRI